MHPIGLVFGDNLLYLLGHRGTQLRGARAPDASFIRTSALPARVDLTRPFPGAPTLAVEVMSPDDKVPDLLKRLTDYFAAGTEQVWVAHPDTQELHQHRRGAATIRIYRGGEPVETGDLFPGLMLTPREVFRLPPRWSRDQPAAR